MRRISDEAGDTGSAIVLFLPNAATAKRAMQAMQEQGVPAGSIYDAKIKDWHIYSNWEHILERKSVSPDGLPWSGVPESQLPRYSRDMCPKTLDYLSRAVVISNDWQFTEQDCKTLAEGMNKALASLEA